MEILWSPSARESLALYRKELEILGTERVARMRILSILDDAQTYARHPETCRTLVSDKGRPPYRYGPCSGGYLFLKSLDTETLIVLFVRDAEMPDVLTDLSVQQPL